MKNKDIMKKRTQGEFNKKNLKKFQGANMANKAWKTLRVGKTKEQHFSLLSNF